MRSVFKRSVVIITIVIVAIFAFVFFVFYSKPSVPPIEPLDNSKNLIPIYKVIGTSVEERKIESYTYGNGKNELVLALLSPFLFLPLRSLSPRLSPFSRV